MSELERMDVIWCVRRLPADVRVLMERRGPDVFLAGGFIRACIATEEVRDVDLFAKSDATAKEMAYELAICRGRKVFVSDNAVSVDGRPSVQFIHRWTFESPAACVASFDFTIASAAIWYEGGQWKSVAHQRFYADLAAKRLVYLSPDRNEDAGGSMLRLLKFYSRGYRAPLDTVGAVVTRLVGGMRDPETGVQWCNREPHDVAKVLTGLLREVDPSVDPTHAAHLPSDSEKQS